MAARRVLVIEDDAGSRDALGSLLSEEGYLVRTAGSGEDALRCARDFRPDTVVCDYRLPDISGLQVLRRLRALPEGVCFIALTADCGGEEAERAIRREADYFLSKPVDLARFRAVLAGVQPLDRAPSHRVTVYH